MSSSTIGVTVDFDNALLPQRDFSGCELSFVERSPFSDTRLNLHTTFDVTVLRFIPRIARTNCLFILSYVIMLMLDCSRML